MKKYNIKDFEWFVYEPKSSLTISFLHEKQFTLNPALHKSLGNRIDVAFSRTERAIALRPSDSDTSLKVKANGAISAMELSEKLIASGFKPPMYFVVEKQGENWIAEPDPTKVSKVIHPSKRPRTINTDRLMKGVDLL